MTASSQYIKEIYKDLNFWGTWLPGTPLKVGTVGIFKNSVFIPQSDLNSFGIKYDQKEDPSPEDITYQSKKGVVMEFKAKGATSTAFENLSRLDAGVGISFKGQNAVVFSARDCFHHMVADFESLKRNLLEIHARHTWPDDYSVITHLISASSLTVLLSGSTDSRVEIRAQTDIGNNLVDLADVTGNLSLAFTRGMNIQIVAAHGLTPLFKAIRIKKKFWTNTVEIQLLENSLSEPEFEELTLENVGK